MEYLHNPSRIVAMLLCINLLVADCAGVKANEGFYWYSRVGAKLAMDAAACWLPKKAQSVPSAKEREKEYSIVRVTYVAALAGDPIHYSLLWHFDCRRTS